jgi:uncharacterized RmlC-like cupin family protein
MKYLYAVEVASDGMIYVPSFMKIGSGIPVKFKLLSGRSGSVHCWYYQREEYAAKMTPDDVTNTPNLHGD